MSSSIDPNPKVWGPPLWRKLHKITFEYPEQIDNSNPQDINIKNSVRRLFMELRTAIPCKECRDSYKVYIKRRPIDPHLHSRYALSKWLYDIHNMVNAKLRKKERDLFNKKMQELDAYARVYRISPTQRNEYKELMKSKIMITGPDPTYQQVKNMYS